MCDPVQDHEILYRRIPESTGWYNPVSGVIRLDAFRPTKGGIDGLSITRAKHTSIDRAAIGRPGKQYFVASLEAEQVFSLGMTIEPDPLDTDSGHSLIPEITYPKRKNDQVMEWMKSLADTVLSVNGPYVTPETS